MISSFVRASRALSGLIALFVAMATLLIPARGAFAATSHNPFGSVGVAVVRFGEAHLVGWTIDPDTTASINARVTVDGTTAATVLAAAPRPKVNAAYPTYHGWHGFDVRVPLSDGTHQVCVVAVNVRDGEDTSLTCVSMVSANQPVGAITSATYQSGKLLVSGWALDPNTRDAVSVQLSLDTHSAGTVTASGAAAGLPDTYATYGSQHGFAAQLPVSPGKHSVCATVSNIGVGSDTSVGCASVTAGTVPAAPATATVTATATTATVTWTAPADTGGSAITGYTVNLSSGRSQSVAGSASNATFAGLTPSTSYSVTVNAVNAIGAGPSITKTFRTGATVTIPPQTTPAPVSTSHYLRNLNGNITHDTTLMRAMGAKDAGYNPSGHRYLVLQDIGAQSGNGVILSATITYISYSDLVASLNAYVDGYVTAQKSNAPMTMAIGTNNDGAVNYTQGTIWADQVVDPVVAHAAKYANIHIAGANDMEPGFSASVTATRSWLSGYLSATPARFFFNGSADGCPTSTAYSRCNNGWTTADLHWLAGGANSTQLRVLPQIYNTTMPLQWRTISLTGSQTVRFAGPLTEWTACAQAGGCGSLTNVYAWQVLFNDLNANARTALESMPFGTDLRIN